MGTRYGRKSSTRRVYPSKNCSPPTTPIANVVAQAGDYDVDGWLKILDKNPVLLQDPITINGDRAKVVRSRADILKL